MYQMSKKAFHDHLYLYARKIDQELYNKHGLELFPLNAMTDRIGEIFRTAVRSGKPYLPANEFDVYAGLIDEETVLVLTYEEFTEACIKHQDEIWTERIEEEDEDVEEQFSHLDSCEVLVTWIEHNPYEFVWKWLGDRP